MFCWNSKSVVASLLPMLTIRNQQAVDSITFDTSVSRTLKKCPHQNVCTNLYYPMVVIPLSRGWKTGKLLFLDSNIGRDVTNSLDINVTSIYIYRKLTHNRIYCIGNPWHLWRWRYLDAFHSRARPKEFTYSGHCLLGKANPFNLI